MRFGPLPRPAILDQYEGRWVATIVEHPNTMRERIVKVVADAATSSELVHLVRSREAAGEDLGDYCVEYVQPPTDVIWNGWISL